MKLEKFEYAEKRVVKMTFSATAEELEAGAQAAYERTRDTYKIKGFEKGEADRAAIEAERGEHVFWYDAINDIMDRDVGALIAQAAADNQLEFVGQPSYDLVSVKKDEGFVATATICLRPELTLTRYTGLVVQCSPVPVTEKEVDAQIERVRRVHAELVPHKGPAVKGNVVILDYEGRIDGEVFQGGSAKEQKLTLGSGRMIPGFEEGILGHAAGEEFDINVTFPANYQARQLAGKAAVFHIVLHSVNVNQLPALNADFAKNVGKVDTMEEYRAAVRKQIETNRFNTAMSKARNDLMLQVGLNAEGELPTPLVEEEYNSQMRQFQYQMQMMHVSMAQFLQQTKQSKEEFNARMREGAEQQLRVRLAMNLVAEKEGLLPTDEELEAEIAARAGRSKKTVEEYKQSHDAAAIRRGMIRQRAQAFVLAHCTIAGPDGQPVTEA